MKRLLPWLGSLFVFIAAAVVVARDGREWFRRKDRIVQPYPLTPGSIPWDELPTSVAKLGPGRNEVQFIVTNPLDVPLIYWGWFPEDPVIRADRWRNGAWREGTGPMCGTGLVDQRLEPGKSVKFIQYLGEKRTPTRYFIQLSTADRKRFQVFLGEYFPE